MSLVPCKVPDTHLTQQALLWSCLPELPFSAPRTLVKQSVDFSAALNLSVSLPGGTKHPLCTVEHLNKEHVWSQKTQL